MSISDNTYGRGTLALMSDFSYLEWNSARQNDSGEPSKLLYAACGSTKR